MRANAARAIRLTTSDGNTMDLGELHTQQLRALDAIDRLCSAHGIDYVLLYGSLLGAVRHGGFIPWDDDVDIGMKRSEYDRFAAIASRELDDGFFLQTHESDAGYPLSFAKVRVDGTSFLEPGFANSRFHNGIYVDVFPLDSAPNSAWARRVHANVLRLVKTAALSRSDNVRASGLARAVVYTSLRVLTRPFPLSTLMGWQDRVASAFNSMPSDRLVSNGGPYGYARETFPASIMSGSATLAFEGRSVPGPAEWDKYLSHLYGNYRELPPEHERIARHLS